MQQSLAIPQKSILHTTPHKHSMQHSTKEKSQTKPQINKQKCTESPKDHTKQIHFKIFFPKTAATPTKTKITKNMQE